MKRLLRPLALGSLAALAVVAPGTAGPDKVQYPAGWKDHVQYLTVDRYDIKQHRELYASSQAAVDAMKAGEIDAISNLDPVITRLQQDGAIRIITDSRFPRVNYDIFGGTNPPAVLYAKREFIVANPNTMQALVNAFYKTLKWIATATTDEIVDTVPADYFLGDRAIYVKALKANLLIYSKTGLMTRQGMNSALNMLATFDPDLKGAKIDLPKTFDDRFVKRAAVLFDDPTNSDLERDERRPEIDLKTFRD